MKLTLSAFFILVSALAARAENDVKFMQVEHCTKSKVCLSGKHEAGLPVTLLYLLGSKTCSAVTGGLVETKNKMFPIATTVQNYNCEDIKKFSQVIAGKKENIIFGTEKVIDSKDKAAELDKIVRKSDVWNPNTRVLADKAIGQVEFKIGRISQIRLNNDLIYIVKYNRPDISTFGYVLQVLVRGNKVFEVPTKGASGVDEIFSFRVDDANYIQMSAHCSECDSWTGSEIFKVSDDGVRQVHIEYDRK